MATTLTCPVLLGDSITEITCWRPQVWSQIVSAGLANNVDFVGSMTNLQSNCQKPSGFDANHEGHSGYQAVDVAKNNIAGWLQNTKPDVIQFMLGTNDVNIGKRTANQILDSYTSLVASMRAANPKVKIIVSRVSNLAWKIVNEVKIDKLIPTSWSDNTIEAVNVAIPGWVQKQSTAQSPITIADCSRNGGYVNAYLRSDGVHPNDQGDQYLAKQIGPKVIQAVKDVLGNATVAQAFHA